MLDDFFKLNGTPSVRSASDDMPKPTRGTEIAHIRFLEFPWGRDGMRISNVTFRNVSMAKIKFSKITFIECIFEDCIFIGSQFEEVEFHKCRFVNCNMWKAKFRSCYLNPASIFLDKQYRKTAANVGVSLYQSLLRNYLDAGQDKHYATADIEFRRWKRYQWKYEIKEGKIAYWRGYLRVLSSWGADVIAGYGYKPFRFSMATIGIFVMISILNHFVIGSDLLVNGQRPQSMSFVDSIYYSFSVLTVLGFSMIVPDGQFAKLLTVAEAFGAIAWLSVLTAVLVKRFFR
jgi:hypothetical protein